MNQQTRQVLFVVLSMGILLGWIWMTPAPAPPPKPAASSTISQGPSKEASSSTRASKTDVKSSGKSAAVRKTSDVSPQEIKIETDLYTATFSNEGGVLTGFQLKKYLNRHTQKPMELVQADPLHPRPFSMTYEPMPDLNHKRFEVKGSSRTFSKADDNGSLVFRYADEKGTVLEKTFGFKNNSYLIDVDMTVSQTGRGSVPASNLILEWADTLGQEENTGTSSRVQGYHVATFSGNGVEMEAVKKSQESKEIPPPFTWSALANQFFMAALIPDSSSGSVTAKVVRDFNAFKAPSQEDPNPGVDPKVFTPRPLLIFPGSALVSGQSFQKRMKVFLGPQDYSLLKALNLKLENVLDLGMFGFISVYMLELLKWFYTWAHSWGLAIILLSLMVKLLLWFPTHSSYKNMSQMSSKMKEIQPKLEAVKKKYANDRQKQQQETMALYQQAGINPMGGCLPMLFQMPVFFALYATLSHSIELRGAPFLWLHDLSLKDPYFVFSLLMGGSMFLQQKVSGQMSTQAAGQQKMMLWMMPIILTFISKDWPSGLLVYWVVTNLLSMIQQKVVNREIQKAKKKDEVSKI